jgi:hypothetical protein
MTTIKLSLEEKIFLLTCSAIAAVAAAMVLIAP